MKKLFFFALLFSPVLIFTQNWSTVTKSCFIEVLPAVRTTHVPEAGWLEIFPNPTAGWVFVRLPETVEDMACKVLDAKGRVVLQQIILGDQPGLNLGSLLPGLYYLVLTNGQMEWRLKIVRV